MKVLLYEIRKRQNFTLRELAKKTGYSSATLNNYENQKTFPNLIALENIATVLNCKITDLFDSEIK